MQPICSKDGVTNFYSPCHAGCTISELAEDANNEGANIPKRHKREKRIYKDCSCVATASSQFNTSLSREWIQKDVLTKFDKPPPLSIIDETLESWQMSGDPVTEAVTGWCEVPGCKTKFYYWIAVMSVLSILGSTSRVGNVLVALRCVEVRDKALSFALQVVALSLLAMLPSPIFYGIIIDNTCILWQEECGETTNCLLYDTDKLRQYLMLTTAGIMLIGVFFDALVVYYAKDVKLFEDPKTDLEDAEAEDNSNTKKSETS